jgi:hypothetical protein
MVERWWGRRGVYARDFASLVRPASGGILTTDLVAATRARGWDTRAFRGTPELVRHNLDDGIPVVALIQVARDRYHYVVVVGWSDGRVVYHDPATAPYTSIDEDAFLARWTGADRWALVVRPAPVVPVKASTDATVRATAEATVRASADATVRSSADATVRSSADATVRSSADGAAPVSTDSTMPCALWLDRALDAAADNRLDDASTVLAQAGRACPTEPLVLRETAGVRFRQGRHPEVIRLASEYLALVPDDELAWQLLATSRYLAGDRGGALEAWNRMGRPTVDLVRIDGMREIRFREIARAISLPAGTLLTSSRLALARRRASDVPALRQVSVDYQPVPGGIVEVRAAVLERPVVDPAWQLVAAGAIGAVTQKRVSLRIASPTGGGELWTAGWRWESARSRAVFRLDMPADPGLPGVIAIEGAWERFRFSLGAGGTAIFDQTRRSAVVAFGGWIAPWLRTSAALRLERWSGDQRYLAASVGAQLRARDDRFQLSARTEHAVAVTDQPSYTSGAVRAAWASSLGLSRTAWSARLGFDRVGRHAPIGTWPMAGGNLDWALPLRAHSATIGRSLAGRSAGRGIISAGIAGDHPVHRTGPLVFAAGLFLDAARIVSPADGSPDRFHLDGGAGLRIGIADGRLGIVRIDLARSLVADRDAALTFGVEQNWPLFQPVRH